MSDKNDESELKYCVYCGAELEEDRVYCPKCGKLVVKAKDKKEKGSEESSKRAYKQKEVPGRECPECGSIIKSRILKQCPICNSKLTEPPLAETEPKEEETGFIFTGEKLRPQIRLKKESWNLREGFNVVGNSILIYIAVYFIIFTTISYFIQSPPGTITIFDILVGQIPEVFLGLYPVVYILSKNHSYEKLGLNLGNRQLILAGFIGIAGGITLYFINDFMEIVIELFKSVGFNIFAEVENYFASYAQSLQAAEFYWIILFAILIITASISSEMLFRGTFHNTLKEKFGKNLRGKAVSILLVALAVSLAYSILFLIFNFPIGIYFLLLYFLINLILGIIYELNGNLANSIITYTVYNLIILLMMIYF
jgi:membrane protease YdiL (CAAX protease family)/predicted RNA-binding Zn-ribbon protein involved in translation (DUF1610 family)